MDPFTIVVSAVGLCAADLGAAVWRRRRKSLKETPPSLKETPAPPIAMRVTVHGLKQQVRDLTHQLEVQRTTQLEVLQRDLAAANQRVVLLTEQLTHDVPKVGQLHAVVTSGGVVDGVYCDHEMAAGRAQQIRGVVRTYVSGFVLINFWNQGR